MEAAGFSVTSVTLCQTTRRYIPLESNLHIYNNETLKSHSKSPIYIQTEANDLRFGTHPAADRTLSVDHRLINSLIWARAKLRLFC